MSNISLQGLDKLDRKILSRIYFSNGRESIANLSRSLSRTAVAERINRLLKNRYYQRVYGTNKSRKWREKSGKLFG